MEESTVSDEVKDKVKEAIKNLDEAIASGVKDDITQKLSDLYAAAQPIRDAKTNSTETVVEEAEVL
jgi:ribosomal protein S20